MKDLIRKTYLDGSEYSLVENRDGVCLNIKKSREQDSIGIYLDNRSLCRLSQLIFTYLDDGYTPRNMFKCRTKMRFVEEEDNYIDTITGFRWSKENFGPMDWDEVVDKQPVGWRLPTLEELLSVVNSKKIGPATELPGIEQSYYWSSTTYAHRSDGVRIVNFYDGYDSYGYKSHAHYVRYVMED